MTHTIFITGTGTDVGKTVVARGIIGALVKKGLKVAALKPVESGAREVDGKLVGSDAEALGRVSGQDPAAGENSAYLLREPVSPHLAAAKENVKVSDKRIVDLVEKNHENPDVIVVEGAGGLLVPLNEDLLYGDLVARLDCQLLIVAPNILGTINATLMTIECARNRGIEVAGFILNGTPDTELGNEEAITRFGKADCLGVFPTTQLDDDELAKAALANLNLDRISGTKI